MLFSALSFLCCRVNCPLSDILLLRMSAQDSEDDDEDSIIFEENSKATASSLETMAKVVFSR